jgi:hypothetical protein
MKIPIILVSIFIIFVALFLPAFLSLGIRFVPYDIQPSLDRVETIAGYQIVSQEFISQSDRLMGFALSLKNPYLRNKKDIALKVYDNGQLIRTSILNGGHIEDGQYVKFLFEPIDGSLNKPLRLTLSSADSNSNEALQVFYTANKQTWVGDLKLNEELVPGFAVSFVTLHQPASIFAPAIDIYSGWFNRLIADFSFFIFYLVFILIGLGFLVFNRISKKTRE